MKSQSLPMRTVAIILIALVALVVVAVFFYSSFNYGKNSTNILTDTSNSQINNARCDAASIGSCPEHQYCNPENGECVTSCPIGYCACNDYMTCVSDCDSYCNGKTGNCVISGGVCS